MLTYLKNKTFFNLKKTPLRTVLITPFVILTVIAVGLTGYLSFRNGRQAVNNVAAQLRSEITTQIGQRLETFLETPKLINQNNANAIQLRLLDANDPVALERYFWEQIQVFDTVTSIYFGNPRGGLIDAGREGAGGFLYVIATDNFVSGPFRKYATDDRGNQGELLTTIPNFDARTRPWYTNAVKTGQATWSDIYILFTGQDMAIAASRPVYDTTGGLLGVVSSDLFLSHISNFLQNLAIGKTGEAFIVEHSGLLVASSTGERLFTADQDNQPPRRLHAAESNTPLVKESIGQLVKQFGSLKTIESSRQFEFNIDGRRYFAQVASFHEEQGPDWLIVVVIPEDDFVAQIKANTRTTMWLIVGTLGLTIVAGLLTARWVTQPLLSLNQAAKSLAKGDQTQPVSVGKIKEIGELTVSFNDMAHQLQQTLMHLTSEIVERKRAENTLRESNYRLEAALNELRETQNMLVRKERLAAVGQLAAGIAHDFNNILTSILGYAELLQISPDMPASVQPDLARIIKSGQRAAHLVRQLLDFSRKSIHQPQVFNLVPLIKESVKFLEHTIPENIHIHLEIASSEHLIKADPTQIQQLLTNLAVNARDAMPRGGELGIKVLREEIEREKYCVICNQAIKGEWVSIEVTDTGHGIQLEALPHIFEPFFTTKEVDKGVGLGLSQVYGIVSQHAGHITVKSQVDYGTTITIFLPLASKQDKNGIEESKSPPLMLSGQGETVLLVEDEPSVLEASKAMLEYLGYQVITATNGREALAIYQEYKVEIALVLSDIVMPDMGGEVLFYALKEQNPDIKMVLMSGYPLGEQEAKLLEQGLVAWFEKPMNLGRLSHVLGQVLLNRKGPGEQGA